MKNQPTQALLHEFIQLLWNTSVRAAPSRKWTETEQQLFRKATAQFIRLQKPTHVAAPTILIDGMLTIRAFACALVQMFRLFPEDARVTALAAQSVRQLLQSASKNIIFREKYDETRHEDDLVATFACDLLVSVGNTEDVTFASRFCRDAEVSLHLHAVTSLFGEPLARASAACFRTLVATLPDFYFSQLFQDVAAFESFMRSLLLYSEETVDEKLQLLDAKFADFADAARFDTAMLQQLQAAAVRGLRVNVRKTAQPLICHQQFLADIFQDRYRLFPKEKFQLQPGNVIDQDFQTLVTNLLLKQQPDTIRHLLRTAPALQQAFSVAASRIPFVPKHSDNVRDFQTVLAEAGSLNPFKMLSTTTIVSEDLTKNADALQLLCELGISLPGGLRRTFAAYPTLLQSLEVADQLRQLRVPPAQYFQYVTSPVVAKLLETGLIQTQGELERAACQTDTETALSSSPRKL